MVTNKELVLGAFPKDCSDDVIAVCEYAGIDLNDEVSSETVESEIVEVSCYGEKIYIPYRVDFSKPDFEDKRELANLLSDMTSGYSGKYVWKDPKDLNDKQRAIFYCLFSRHLDGYTREKCLAGLLPLQDSFIVAYVMCLVGEYVIEVVSQINDNRESFCVDGLRDYVENNLELYELLKQKAASYWNVYYSPQNGETNIELLKHEYPAFLFFDYVDKVVRSQTLKERAS